MAKAREDKAVQQDFQTLSRSPSWASVKNAMVIFCMQCQDPIVRAGRMDMLLFIERQITRATEKDDKAEEPE